MSVVQSSPPTGASAPPPLPEGWRYSEEVERLDEYATARRRKLAIIVAVSVVAVLAVALLLLVLNAQRHYSRGMSALAAERYAEAASELSAARLLVFSYRDAGALADQAQRGLLAQTQARLRAEERAQAVTAALDDAVAALATGSAARVSLALGSVSSADLQVVLRDDAGARRTADALAQDLVAEGRRALGAHEWGRARSFAESLLVLVPASEAAAGIASKAGAGEKLAARMDDARSAARRGEWREALRLALAVRAAHEDFPGAAALIADARQALKPPPTPEPTASASAPITTGGGTSNGGSSSQPPPP